IRQPELSRPRQVPEHFFFVFRSLDRLRLHVAETLGETDPTVMSLTSAQRLEVLRADFRHDRLKLRLRREHVLEYSADEGDVHLRFAQHRPGLGEPGRPTETK